MNRYNDLVLYSDNLQDELDHALSKLDLTLTDYHDLEEEYIECAAELEKIPAWIRRIFR